MPMSIPNSTLQRRPLNMKYAVKKYPYLYLYLLPLDFLGCKHVIDTDIKGLTPQFAVSPLCVSRGHISRPWPWAEQVRATVAAETDGALARDNRVCVATVSHYTLTFPIF